MEKSIRYLTQLKYVEYVEICVLSSQQTSLKYFVSLEVYFPKLSKPIFFSDFNFFSLCGKRSLGFPKKSSHYSFLGEERVGGGGAGRGKLRLMTRQKGLRGRLRLTSFKEVFTTDDLTYVKNNSEQCFFEK